MPAFEPILTGTRRPRPTTAPPAAVRRARPSGRVFTRQDYSLYSEANHATWQYLYHRMERPWDRYANDRFLEGLECLRLKEDRVPRLDDVNAFLAPRTGGCAQAVSGYVPAFVFLDCLRNRKLPTAVAIRSAGAPDCLSEPDIFHDVAGHVPMHTERTFTEALVAFGNCAGTAVDLVRAIRVSAGRLRRVTSIVKAMARFYWFTFEVGLVRYGDRLKAYGSRLLSSASELEHAMDAAHVQRCDMRLDWVIHQPFEAASLQPLLFSVESFDHLHELVSTLERWMREGRLDHVAWGHPWLAQSGLDRHSEACAWR